jgi:rhomboid family GlyGly-CTERM serine protease
VLSGPADWRPALVLSGLSGALLLAPPAWRAALLYDRSAVVAGQWWRLFSANFLHLGVWHWLLNVLSLVLLALLCPERASAAAWAARILAIGSGTCLGLYLGSPQIASYVGMSGMIYGLFLLGLGRQAIQGDRIAIACLVFLAARVGWELHAGIPHSEEKLIGGHVVPQSHLYGMAAALVYGAGTAAAARIKTQLSSAQQTR